MPLPCATRRASPRSADPGNPATTQQSATLCVARTDRVLETDRDVARRPGSSGVLWDVRCTVGRSGGEQAVSGFAVPVEQVDPATPGCRGGTVEVGGQVELGVHGVEGGHAWAALGV